MPLPGGDPTVPGSPVIDPMLSLPSDSGSGTPVEAVLTFFRYPTDVELLTIEAAGLQTFPLRALPMVGVRGTRSQVLSLAGLPGLRSIYANRPLAVSFDQSIRSVDPSATEAGCTDIVAALDNVRLAADPFGTEPLLLEGLTNTDATAGQRAQRAAMASAFAGRNSVAAGERMTRIGTSGRPFALTALQAFDWTLQNRLQYGITAICGRLGASDSFSPEDPINLATKIARDAGLVVVAGDRPHRLTAN